jgi:hypothetical protein
MTMQRISCLLLAMAAAASPHSTLAATHPDSTLLTTYRLGGSGPGNLNTLWWSMCGSVTAASGCFASGALGPFGQIGALLEGPPVTKGSIVNRQVFVLDTASGTAANGVTLYVFKEIITVGTSTAATTISQIKKLTLPLTGGANAHASMAANAGFVYVGTDQSPQAVQVQKSNWTVTQLGSFSPPLYVTAITANSYGYVTITQGSMFGNNGFFIYGPSGGGFEEGGGPEFVLDTMNAVVPGQLPLLQ